MLDFSVEIDRLRPHLGDRVTDELIARERREAFSLYPEVVFAAWAGALLIATGAGIFIKENLEHIDRVIIAAVLTIAAAACYGWVWRSRRATGQPANPVTGFVLLLGALLVSADVGFIEQQWDLFGTAGVRHLLLLALFHAATAYRFESRLVLTVALASLAAWLGLDRVGAFGGREAIDLAVRAFACSVFVLCWRAVHIRRAGADRSRSSVPRSSSEFLGRSERGTFPRLFEHFAANLALSGGILLLDRDVHVGAVVTIAIAALVIGWGFRVRVESFVLYSFIYAVVATVVCAMRYADDELAIFFGTLIAIPGLVLLHRRIVPGQP